MENDYNLKIELDKNITYETNQILKIIIHGCLIGSLISFLIGALLYIT